MVIAHDSVSRQHCQIDFLKGVFYITDLGSSNGSFIDGHKLEPQVKTPFLSSQHITLGILECEISQSSAPTDSNAKILSSGLSEKGGATVTLRLARIDLNRPAVTPEIEKNKKLKGPRNPVTMNSDDEKAITQKSKKPLIILVVIVFMAAAWFLIMGE